MLRKFCQRKLSRFLPEVLPRHHIDGVTFSEGDTFLTLSTCCRKYDKTNSGNQRLVVMAKLLPEGGDCAGVQRIPCG